MSTPNHNASAWSAAPVPVLESSRLPSSVLMGSVLIGALLAISFFVGPKVDGVNEPPVLKPTIPLIGHIVNLIRHGTMLISIYRESNHANLPAATLPMLNGKMYIIWDVTMIQNVFRKKGFSMEDFAANFVCNVGGLDGPTRRLYHNTPLTMESIGTFSKYLLKGESLRKLNIAAIQFIEKRLHGQFDDGEWIKVPNLYLWLRDTMSLAGSEALWGSNNPLAGSPELMNDFWAFENNILVMALDMFPRLTARRAYAGRANVQAALGKFYEGGHDGNEDVSDLIRERAKLFRQYGLSSESIGKMEAVVLAVALGNTIPTLFWMLTFIVSTPGLAERVREELQPLVRRVDDEAILDVRWDSRCPLLLSCYREVLRLTSTTAITGRFAEDTEVTCSDGRTYTIKAGIDTQISGTASHTIPQVWGANVGEFDPERFLPFIEDPAAEHVKDKKAAFHPFGGGRHMCPGRHFAFTEILTYVALLVIGYDVVPAHGTEWEKPPERTKGSLAEAIAKPVNNGEGFGSRIRRKAGWEKVRWHFDI